MQYGSSSSCNLSIVCVSECFELSSHCRTLMSWSATELRRKLASDEGNAALSMGARCGAKSSSQKRRRVEGPLCERCAHSTHCLDDSTRSCAWLPHSQNGRPADARVALNSSALHTTHEMYGRREVAISLQSSRLALAASFRFAFLAASRK